MNREEWADKERRLAWLRDWIWNDQLDNVEWDDLPNWVRSMAPGRIAKGHVIKTSYIRERIWAPGDTYLVVAEVQVMEGEGFSQGDEIEVTIRKIEKVKDIERRRGE